MIIQHNLSAMNADRQNRITDSRRKKSSEKLSSGYRINRSADDAAGLAISEKMRRQIRGLTQASFNVQDGISMVQTAEGALNEVHDMLQRMNELCIKAANGTMTYDDRSYVQMELDQISTEFDRIGAATEFNNITILDGLPQDQCNAVVPAGTVNGTKGTITQTTHAKVDSYYKVDNFKTGDIAFVTGSGDKEPRYYRASTREEIAAYNMEVEAYSASDQSGQAPVDRDGSSHDKAVLVDMDDFHKNIGYDLCMSNYAANKDLADGIGYGYNVNEETGKTRFNIHFFGPINVTLQVGADEDDTYSFRINSLSAYDLGVLGINVKDNDGTGAQNGIDKVKSAIEKNSKERAKLGAIQNRLEHMVKNIDNVVENTTAAESLIRDTDMSSEIREYSNAGVIAQAGQSMLAQANQSKQGVLSLLG